MRCLVIVKATEESETGKMPSPELLDAMGRFNEKLMEAGVMEAAEGLHPSSKGVRVTFSGDRRIVTDGPFMETKELVAGFWIWKVASMDEAIAWAKECPNPHPDVDGGIIEIRPIFELEDIGEDVPAEVRDRMRAQLAES